MRKVDEVLQLLKVMERKKTEGITSSDIADQLRISRSVASRYLNELVKADKARKLPGKPVKYITQQGSNSNVQIHSYDHEASHMNGSKHEEHHVLIGAEESLKTLLEKGLAALLYPPAGLHILLSGETGVGKSHVAEYLAKLAANQTKRRKHTPFVTFNCADYAQNPELLMGHVFGIKKGAYTGASQDEIGLVEQANGGILFLDEIHRLPPVGQEMLFYLMDKGVYRRLGEAGVDRKAKVILIGATTESLEETLLPTLLRRFSLKLTVPALRERSEKERKQLLYFFLEREAKKMGVPLSITADCREGFLQYACTGNIGQLKSDIQISCARAFLRYIRQNETEVTIKKQDLPSYVTSSLMPEKEMIADEQKILTSPLNETYPFPNIYSQIKGASSEKASLKNDQLQAIVEHYINELKGSSEKRAEAEPAWARFIDHDILEALREAAFYFKNEFPFDYHMKHLVIIGMHLQAFRKHLLDGERTQQLPLHDVAKPIYREAAQRLADFLQQRIHLHLPREEVELIAHFFAPQEDGKRERRGVAILVATHGDSTASSMASVTNYLLGNQVIHAIDMPLNEPTSVTYHRLFKKIEQIHRGSGVLMLVDIGSLVTIGDTLQKDLGIQIMTLANVNLPMVIEAGRKSLIKENELESVFEATKKAFLTLAPERQRAGHHKSKQRLIATVCFTGEGTAQLLQDWLEKQLVETDCDVVIKAIRIDPVSRDASILLKLKEQYELIGVVGTVPVEIDGIAFIPAWELLQEDGKTRLHHLLEFSRPTEKEEDSDIQIEEIPTLVEQGLSQIVHCLNPKLLCQLLKTHLPSIKAAYHWDINRELGMWMHIGSVVDQMIQSELENGVISLHRDNDVQTVKTTETDRGIWRPLFQAIEENFHIIIPETIQMELIALGMAQ